MGSYKTQSALRNTNINKMQLDDLLSLLGDFGKFQRIAYVLICLPIVFVGMQYMAPVFILATPTHRCAITEITNDTYRIHSDNHVALVQQYVPIEKDNVTYSKCTVYSDGETNNTTARQEVPCSRWVYDTSVFTDSIVTEIDLVCSRSIFRAHATMAFTAGSLVGFLVAGRASDRFGRKTVYICELVVTVGASLLLLWLPGIYVFLALRAVLGASFGVFYNTAFVYAMEFVGPSRRTLCGLLINQFWAFGLLLQAGLAYALRSWRGLHLAMSLPLLIFLPVIWFLPNSVRWLFAKGHREEGIRVVKKMIQMNKVSVNADELDMHVSLKEGCETNNNTIKDNLRLLIEQKSLLVRLLVVSANWFVVNLMYYGLTLNVVNLGGDVYVNFAFSAGMEVVAYAMCIPAVGTLGRKVFHSGCMIVGGIALLITIFIKSSPRMVVALSLVGKLVASAAYATIYLYSLELFPTVARSSAMGMGAFCAGIGGVLAPYIVELGQLLDGAMADVVPLIVFGTASLAAGLSSLVLPETAGARLPDTLADITLSVHL